NCIPAKLKASNVFSNVGSSGLVTIASISDFANWIASSNAGSKSASFILEKGVSSKEVKRIFCIIVLFERIKLLIISTLYNKYCWQIVVVNHYFSIFEYIFLC